MNPDSRFSQQHPHVFLGHTHYRNEKRIWLVIALTTAMMLIEIIGGTLYGSMALIADGWHMFTHAGAMLIAALAYRYARRHADDPQFSFGTGKLGDLAGFASAVALAIIAVLIGWESLQRLLAPESIDFTQATLIAISGLVINLISAWLLREDHHHHHHPAGQEHTHHAQDNNLRAAYLHVLADALTSVLAILALVFGRLYGWYWADPLMGVVGALVIVRWSWGLMRSAGSVLLDAQSPETDLARRIRSAIETDGNHIRDLHVWQVGPGHHAAIIALVSPQPRPPAHYKARLAHLHGLSHLTIEVEVEA